MALAKETGDQPRPPVRASGPRDIAELHFCFAKPQFPCKGSARAKKFATTAEAMLANWVQRHAAFLAQNPAWRTYKYGRTYKCAGKKKKKRNVADEETTKRLIAALEESIKYETYFKLIIATGMRR